MCREGRFTSGAVRSLQGILEALSITERFGGALVEWGKVPARSILD